MQLFVGFVLATIIAVASYRVRSLSRSGTYAATIIGTLIFGLGGWQWALLLLSFFISSSLLTRVFYNQKNSLNEKYSKGGRRDAGQVLGNGGLAALCAVLHILFPSETWPWLAFAASLAAVNADTWATELGVLNPAPPRLITDLRKVVDKGTSGGVSVSGILASLAGAGLIGSLAAVFGPGDGFWSTCLIISLSGLTGSLFDSLLGATKQAIYYCPTCCKETEHHPIHTCNTKTMQIRGWKWLNNDWVNFFCGAFGVIVAILLIS